MFLFREWESHKLVHAEQITDVDTASTPDQVRIWVKPAVPSRGLEKICFAFDATFIARGIPSEGDWLVLYEDGYFSWSPKAQFEKGCKLAMPF